MLFRPRYLVELFRKMPGRNELLASWQIRNLTQAQIENSTDGNVGTAQLVFSDPASKIDNAVRPECMDVVRVWSNSHDTPSSFTQSPYTGMWPVFTGFVDTVQNSADPTDGVTMTLAASTPYKLWEITRLALSPPTATVMPGLINDALVLAQAYYRGVSGNSIVQFTAARVGYQPGFMQAISSNADLQGVVKLGDPTGFVGQYNQSIATDLYTFPDLQTYSAVVQAVIGTTGNELFCDGVGNVIYRPYQYLNVPTPIRCLVPEEIFSLNVATTDAGIVTAVRVRWLFDTYSAAWDGYYQAPDSMIAKLGYRVYTIDAPWIPSRAIAMYLAKSVCLQLAGKTGAASVTIVADPSIQLGTIIAIPSVYGATNRGVDKSQEFSIGYVTGITHTWLVNDTWLETLTLSYLRAPNLDMPYIKNITAALLKQSDVNEAGVGAQYIQTGSGGLPLIPNGPDVFGVTPQGMTKIPGGEILQTFNVSSGTGIPVNTIMTNSHDYPAGTIIQIRDAKNNDFVGGSPNGEYTVVNDDKKIPSGTVVLSGTKLPSAAYIRTVKTVPYTANTDPGATPADPNPPPSSTPGDGSGTASSGQFDPISGKFISASGSLKYWPFIWTGGGGPPVSQIYGPTSYEAEGPYQGVLHFHTGTDFSIGTGTPLLAVDNGIIAPSCSVVGQGTFYTGWTGTMELGSDNTMHGNSYGFLILLDLGNFVCFYGHTLAPGNLFPAGTYVRGRTPIAHSDNTGNSSGPHLHFGVYDKAGGTFVNPMSLLEGATHT